MKKSKTNSPRKRLIVLLAALGIGANFLVNAPSLSAQVPQRKPTNTKEFNQAVHLRDSLSEVNWTMFNVAQEKYFDRVDKKYTMGRFFNKRELRELNRVLAPYLTARAGETDIDYKYVRVLTPIKSSTPLSAFIDAVGILNVESADMAPFDMIFDNGFLYAFNDPKNEDLFEEYLDACADGCIAEEGPNFTPREFAGIRDEYLRNERQIDSLNTVIYNMRRSR